MDKPQLLFKKILANALISHIFSLHVMESIKCAVLFYACKSETLSIYNLYSVVEAACK